MEFTPKVHCHQKGPIRMSTCSEDVIKGPKQLMSMTFFFSLSPHQNLTLEYITVL